MAEEDLIFGKNRHMFGGIEPSDMRRFSISSKNGVINILSVLPNDTIIDEQTICTVAGAVIRRRTDKCPEDEFDGDLIADITESGTVIDSTADLSESYYYRAFPYSAQGVYNRGRSVNNKTKYSPTGSYYVYGYDLDTTNPDPDSRVIYPSDVDNELYEPARMNFTGTTAEGSFGYGSWSSEAGEDFMPRPCMLKRSGSTVAYYLNPDDYNLTVGGDKSDVDNYSFVGEAMMEWPKIYTKREFVDGVYKFRCAPVKVDETYECWCNYDKNGNEIDHFYTSIYKRSTCVSYISKTGYPSNLLYPIRSLSSTDKKIYESRTAEGNICDARYYVQSSGNDTYNDDYTLEVLADHLLIQDLLVMMAKTTDLKSAYGDGWSESGTTVYSAGFEKKGLFYGAPKADNNDDLTGRVKVFGMVDYWDSLYERRIFGWINDCGSYKVKLTRGVNDGSTASDYNITGDGYLTLTGDSVSGYISRCETNDYGRIPIENKGSKTTYECDYVSVDNQGVYFAVIGGENCGPYGVRLNQNADKTAQLLGASISCKPQKI